MHGLCLYAIILLAAACGGGADDAVDGGPTCSLTHVERDYGDLGTVTGVAEQDGNGGSFMTVRLDDGAVDDFLSVELYAGFGIFADGIQTGTFEITEDQYRTCGLCVVIYGDLSGPAENPDAIYFAASGTVMIDDFETGMTGTLADLDFKHVQFAEDNTSTPINDGCETKIGHATYDQAY